MRNCFAGVHRSNIFGDECHHNRTGDRRENRRVNSKEEDSTNGEVKRQDSPRIIHTPNQWRQEASQDAWRQLTSQIQEDKEAGNKRTASNECDRNQLE